MNLVMFGFNDWHEWAAQSFRTRCGSIAKQLARHPDVEHLVVIATPRSYVKNAMRITRERLGAPRDDRTIWDPYSLREVAPGVSVLDHTRLLPRESSRDWLLQLNGRLHDDHLRRAVSGACAQMGMRDYYLWVSDPLMAKHYGRLGESLRIFDAIDDWAVHPQKAGVRRSVEEGYDRVASDADVVFTVSDALAGRFVGCKGVVCREPNGVDSERFEGTFAIPEDLKSLPRPLIGYVGLLQERVDIELLKYVSGRMPDATLVLIGPEITPDRFDGLRNLSNVRMLGARRPEDVPSYVNAFDVCVVPHVDDAFTRSMDPLKVYEYLAAGRPVVARGVADLGEPGGLISRASSAEEFVGMIRSALTEPAGRNDDRRAFARSRSWSTVTENMMATIRRTAEDVGGRVA